MTFAASSLVQQGFGPSAPASGDLSLEGGMPGWIPVEGSLDGTFSLGQGDKPRFDLGQGRADLRKGRFFLSLGRLFMASGIPAGYQDGGLLEARVLRRTGLRIQAGAPVRFASGLSRGRTWGGGVFHRGKAWGGAFNADLGYLIHSGQARVWTGSEAELLPFISRETAGGTLSWSRHGAGVSSILQYDLLYRRWNEVRFGAHLRRRDRATVRAEARLLGSSLPGDSIFVTFAGAARTWWQGSGGFDLPLGRVLLRLDSGLAPGRGKAWVEAGVQSRSGPWRPAGGLKASWGFSARRETGRGTQNTRFSPRLELRLGRDWALGLRGNAGRLELPGRPAPAPAAWSAGLSLARKLGAGEAQAGFEAQKWLTGQADHRADLAYSVPLGGALGRWKRP